MKLKYIIALTPFLYWSCEKDLGNGNIFSNNDTLEASISENPNFNLQNKKSQEIITEIEEKQKQLKIKLKKAKGKNVDNLYLEYSKIFDALIKELDANEFNSFLLYNKWENEVIPDSIKQKLDLYDKLQIKIIENNDGTFTLKFRSGFYYDMFKSKASRELREYLKIATLQRKKPIVVNGVINEDWSEISNRLIIWEKYIKENPNSKYKENAKGKYLELIQLYLLGNKNDRPFSFENKKFLPENEQEFLKTIKKHGKSTTGVLTKNYLDYFYTNDKNFASDEFVKNLTEYTNSEIEKEMKKF
nr:hypothetical protein [uncultured Flavobacterium sp.]